MRATILVCASLATAIATPAVANDLSASLVGVWKIAEFSTKDLSTGATTQPYGERPCGRVIYTKGGHYVFFLASGNQPKPTGPMSDADRVELYKGLVAFSGTYRVEGNSIVPTSTDVAWVPGYQYAGATIEITGNRLVTTSKPLKSPSTGREIVITTVAERME